MIEADNQTTFAPSPLISLGNRATREPPSASITPPAKRPQACSPHQGLRPTTAGGHVAIVDAISAHSSPGGGA
jgi:hypothetical protein